MEQFLCLLLFYRKTIEKVIYFMLLERKERSPTHEDAAVASIKHIKEICKCFKSSVSDHKKSHHRGEGEGGGVLL